MQRTTERRNPDSTHIDEMSTAEILQTINAEDQKVPLIVGQAPIIDAVAQVVDAVVKCLANGGRLFYIGAGTSGRLGVLDAAECVPTFGTDPELVQGLIAGGFDAMLEAVEGAEDSMEGGEADLKAKHLSAADFVLGIAASGSTPYVIGGLDYANQVGAVTGALSCNEHSLIGQHATYQIDVVVGPEVVTGSTRMKAGTAQKLVLNMISTSAMIKLGKVYENLMVDVKATNIKLVDRAKRIIADATGVDAETANTFYEASEHNPKVAIVMIRSGESKAAAEAALAANAGFISATLRFLKQ